MSSIYSCGPIPCLLFLSPHFEWLNLITSTMYQMPSYKESGGDTNAQLQDFGHRTHCADVGTKPLPRVNLQLILKTICVSLIVLFTQSVSEKLSFGKSLSAAAVWSSPPPCYFSAVSVILWIMAQTPMRCDRVFPLRFPNQVSSSPPSLSLFFLPSHRTSVFGRELCPKDSRLCLFWKGANSLFFLPSFPIWDGCCKAAKSGAVITLPQRDFSFHHFINCRREIK